MMQTLRVGVMMVWLAAGLFAPPLWAQNPHVVMETNFGNLVVELYADASPVTVDNFLHYVNTGFYDNLLFHRVIYEFMIQGGGYYLDGYTIIPSPPTAGPIINESENGLSNLRGTIAMARTADPDSATAQFYINHADNLFLDRENASDGYGYCVFGQVVSGMDVVDAIAEVQICRVSDSLSHFPCNPPVVIDHAYVIPCDVSYCSDLAGGGQIDFADFAEFACHWLDECRSANDFCDGRDLDYSGAVDVSDLDLFLQQWHRTIGYEPFFSDLDETRAVDRSDLLLFLTHWLADDCSPGNDFCEGTDLDHSGTVDITDFSLFGGNWLSSY